MVKIMDRMIVVFDKVSIKHGWLTTLSKEKWLIPQTSDQAAKPTLKRQFKDVRSGKLPNRYIVSNIIYFKIDNIPCVNITCKHPNCHKWLLLYHESNTSLGFTIPSAHIDKVNGLQKSVKEEILEGRECPRCRSLWEQKKGSRHKLCENLICVSQTARKAFVGCVDYDHAYIMDGSVITYEVKNGRRVYKWDYISKQLSISMDKNPFVVHQKDGKPYLLNSIDDVIAHYHRWVVWD